MTMQTRVRYVPADMFPITIELFAEDNGELMFSAEMAGPGMLDLPPHAPRKVMVRIQSRRLITYRTSAGVEFEVGRYG